MTRADTNGMVCMEVRPEDVRGAARPPADEQTRRLILRSGLPGTAKLFSTNAEEAAQARLRLIRSFASKRRRFEAADLR